MELASNRLEELTWDEVRLEVKRVNPELTAIIDAIDPNKTFKLIRASYRFGDSIVKQGELFLPGKQDPVSLNEASETIQAQLGYCATPLFLTLQNCNEVFIETASRVIPMHVSYPGNFLGLFETLGYLSGHDDSSKSNISAGIRSIFMLQKINRMDALKRLRFEFELSLSTKIQTINDHWHVFKQIAQHPHFTQDWCQQVLFFTKDWFVRKDAAWFDFHRYLYGQAWRQIQFSIKDFGLNLGAYGESFSSRNIKLTPYLLDQIKHILLIAKGKWLGFRPSIDDRVAPIQGLEEAFLNVYQLKQNPTFMHPILLNQENKLPVYYSLASPTLFDGAPRNDSSATIMLNLRDIKNYLKILSESLSSINCQDNFLKNIQFNYFHVEPDKYHEIVPSTQIYKVDELFSNFPENEFCYTSPFWRGCIQIAFVNN